MSTQITKSAVVTGAGSGLGRDIALGLSAKGYRVFGTAISSDEITDLSKASGGAVTLSQCDITDEAAVRAWAGEVTRKNQGRVDLLISNAGILTPGPLEVLTLNAIRHEFEVNVFGALAVVNAFLPALRSTQGRIVQVSTMTATLPFPFNGPSGASKAAFDALAAVYRAELEPFGVDVVLAVAGNMRTGGPAKTAAALKRVAEQMTPGQRELYGKAFDIFATTLNNMQGSGLDSVLAAKRVIELAEQVPAPSRGAVGADAEAILRLVREKSDAELDEMRLHMVGLESSRPRKPTIIASDEISKKNVATVLALYDEMINKNQPAAAVKKFLRPDYIQHNPLIPTSAASLGDFFGQVISAHKNLHVVVHKVVASGDHVFAHVNFVNIYSDDPNDRGIAGVDIYRFDADGKIAEHWDVLQEVPDAQKSANTNGMF